MGAVQKTFLDALASSEHYTKPYDHWLLSDCLPGETCDGMDGLPYRVPEIDHTEGKRDTHNESRQFITPDERRQQAVLDDIATAFQSRDVVAALQETCRAPLEGTYLRIEYTQDTGNFWLGPHTDVGAKMFTMMIYLSTAPGCEEWGTDVLDSDHNIVRTVPSPFNAGMIFVPAGDTWHGFHQRRISGIRRSLIVNYVSTEWRNRHELAFPDQLVTAQREAAAIRS